MRVQWRVNWIELRGGGGGGGGGCGILLNRLITAGSGGIAPLNSGPAARVFMLSLVKFSG